jgi:hypothetical protein
VYVHGGLTPLPAVVIMSQWPTDSAAAAGTIIGIGALVVPRPMSESRVPPEHTFAVRTVPHVSCLRELR